MTATRLRALVEASHAAPTITVTVVVTALAAAAGRDASGLALVAAATLSGQLSVGWCNDAFDAERDRRAARLRKPTVRGDVTPAVLWRAASLALAATVGLSYLAAGPIGGTAHVVAVLSAWSYNLLLKSTVLSPLPYALSFGLVPVFVTYGLTPASPPAAWLVAGCALLGVAAHLANAIPDADSDAQVDAGGFVTAVGVRTASVVSLVCLVAAVGLLAANVGVTWWVALGAVLVAAAGAVLVAVRDKGAGSGLFRYILALATVAVLLLIVAARAPAGLGLGG